MNREFSPPHHAKRFPLALDDAKLLIGNVPVMDQAMDTSKKEESRGTAEAVRTRASAWLWRPWHAKLWWTAIPIYWLGMAASLKIPLLAEFYSSALAGFLNVFLFPMTALVVLGAGYVREWVSSTATISSGDIYGIPTIDSHRRIGGPGSAFDPQNPRSGGLWIGNPSSPFNPNRR